MDVFGTVVGAIDLIGKLVGYLQAIKGAKEDRLKLLSEISALGALLEVLRDRLDSPSAGGNGNNLSDGLVKTGINHPLRMCLEALGPIVKGLERLSQNVDMGMSSLLAEKMKNLRWPFRQEDIRATLSNIERLKTLVSLALQTSLVEFLEKAREELTTVGLNVEGIKSAVSSLEADQRDHTKRIESVRGDIASLRATLHNAASGIAAVKNAVDRDQQGKERRSVLKWLSAPEFDQKHANAFGRHAANTGEWFLRHPKFVAWRRGEYNVLWCPGNSGVGKSVMTSIIIHNLQEGTVEGEAVVFVYFDYTMDYTTQQLVEALLSQFVRQGISTSNMKLLQKHMVGNRPKLEELWAILKIEVETYARVFVVIDALDEATGSTWIPFLRRLRTLPGIRILATSRDLGNIAAEFQDDHRLDVMSDKGDLRKYVEGRILGSTGIFEQMLKRDPTLHAEIVAGVTKKADGMFLLAQLHMNALQTESRVVDLRGALEKLPGDLTSAYDATINRISDKDRPLALRILSWVFRAARPMTIGDLQYALAIEDGMTAIDTDFLHDPAYITSVCVGLVVVRSELEASPYSFEDYVYHYVGLVHYTVQDHLRDYVSTQLPHPAHLATTCLRYLTFDVFNGPVDEDSRWKLMDTPFVEYAVDLWGEHACIHLDDPTIRHLVMELLNDHQRVSVLGFLARGTEGVSAIQLCAHFGLKDYLVDLLDDGCDVNLKDSNGDTALTVAVIRGHEGIAQLLLARERIDVNPKGRRGATPLMWAVMHRHKRNVELLLAREDVNVNWHDDYGVTLIAHAIKGGHSGIVGLLLARSDVNINLQDIDGCTPLALAIYWEHEAIVRLLLARGDLDIGLTDNGENTHLTLAAYNNNDRIAGLLLAKGGTDVNSRNSKGQTALSVAAYRGNEAVVDVLLARDGIDINVIDLNGKTPLDLAEIKTPDVSRWEEIKERKRRSYDLLREAGARRGVEMGAGLESGGAWSDSGGKWGSGED